MNKNRRWQRNLIVIVLFLTVYNIFPTIFFYTKPLKKDLSEQQVKNIAKRIASRVNHGEEESKEWLLSFCKQLKLKPDLIAIEEGKPQHVHVTFKNLEDANTFRSHLPKAGALIPFVPSQLSLLGQADSVSKTVIVQRKIPIHLDESHPDRYFQFSKKFDESGNPTSLYRALVFDRVLQLAFAASGQTNQASQIQAAIASPPGQERDAIVLNLAQQILSANEILKSEETVFRRYLASFSQASITSRSNFIKNFIEVLDQTKDQIKLERISLQSEMQRLQSQGDFLETSKQQKLGLLISQENILFEAVSVVKKNQSNLEQGFIPNTLEKINQALDEAFVKITEMGSRSQILDLSERNSFIRSINLNWDTQTLSLNLYPDIQKLLETLDALGDTEKKERLHQMIINEIASLSRESGESIRPVGDQYEIELNSLQGSDRFLALRLSEVASAKSEELVETLKQHWKPRHRDLKADTFPILTFDEYQNLPSYEKKLGLVVYAPATRAEMPAKGLNSSSIYILAKGLDKIIQKLQTSVDKDDARLFFDDFNSLQSLLRQNGLFGYPGSTLSACHEFTNDFIFESEDFYLPILNATREAFSVHGTKRFAVLELTNQQQRILAENKILDQIHDELLKWRDEYNSSRIGLGGATPFDVPKPTKNPLIDNIVLSFKKYFRGDDRKVLNWGLDLSGGKTVQIELRDQSGRVVTGDDEIKQGINELYQRVNKMGVSEVSIRREGNFITIDFPGSQDLSASDLIKASTMYFHIVNEKFNEKNASLSDASSQFLQDIWNEAVVTGRKSFEEVNEIAWRHVHGDSFDSETIQPRSEAARTLYENGLRLANPLDHTANNVFNDSISKIAVQRGESFTDWDGKTHPLMIVFRNYALEGSNLKNVEAVYDQGKGNMLSFEVKGKEVTKTGEKINPRSDLFAWTSQFSKDKIVGTPNAHHSSSDGWRMAVILNGSIITHPSLNFSIKENATIEGSFTAREVNQLEADLKAGSLTFTPHILSEKNVSPELGARERSFGIGAIILALILVIAAMISYYRFGGLIASVAVIVNLLIMWATLQNLGATLTLATIAGGILTLGMAVDANVLVFERIREEFAICGRLGVSVESGYRKAFSAIVDSNVTTIIAAIILMQFDSGPIKGFATTLIIGIASSMFTALFMTRYFFTGWVANPKRISMKMSQIIKSAKFDFSKYSKVAFFLSGSIILAGFSLFVKEKGSILGMDFTGGYSLNLELTPQNNEEYRSKVERALTASGALSQDIQVRQLTPSHHIRLFLGKGMGFEGRPFYKMPIETDASDIAYKYESNPRIKWVVDSLKEAGIVISADSLENLEQNWSEISGQLSDSMRNSALIGLAIAIISILLYITIRFEFNYAVSATLCLGHDVFISLASIAALHYFGVSIQIDLNTVAALMTIVGYSLNDTIIVFDRIREDKKIMYKSSFKDITNHALNVTLSRTIMTSITTLLVLLPLVILGGSTIFAFSLVMIIGVVFGTLSSLFIAAPMLRYFHKRGINKGTAAQIARQ